MRPAARHSLPKQPAKRLSRFVSPALSDLICEKSFQFVQLERQCAHLHASFAPSKIRFQRERERERINSRLEIECLQMGWFIHWTIVSKFADNYFERSTRLSYPPLPLDIISILDSFHSETKIITEATILLSISNDSRFGWERIVWPLETR